MSGRRQQTSKQPSFKQPTHQPRYPPTNPPTNPLATNPPTHYGRVRRVCDEDVAARARGDEEVVRPYGVKSGMTLQAPISMRLSHGHKGAWPCVWSMELRTMSRISQNQAKVQEYLDSSVPTAARTTARKWPTDAVTFNGGWRQVGAVRLNRYDNTSASARHRDAGAERTACRGVYPFYKLKNQS